MYVYFAGLVVTGVIIAIAAITIEMDIQPISLTTQSLTSVESCDNCTTNPINSTMMSNTTVQVTSSPSAHVTDVDVNGTTGFVTENATVNASEIVFSATQNGSDTTQTTSELTTEKVANGMVSL